MKLTDQEEKPLVGVFWYSPADGRFLTYLAPALSPETEVSARWVDLSLGHDLVWERVKDQVDWSRYPAYDGEYSYLPRGRVLWDIIGKRHEVLLDRDIDQAALFDALGRFGITREQAVVKTDSHYRSRLLRLKEINREFD
ncbi:MAG: hypothetical protein ACE15E_22730 [Acidobacteriota bacterium]